MKDFKYYLAIAAMLALVTLNLHSQPKKYDIKSSIITYEMVQKVAGMEIKNKIILSFDDYGMRECRETYGEDKITEVYFSDGKDLYTLKPDKKIAVKRGPAHQGAEAKIEWNDISSDDKKMGRAKQLPRMTIAGKTCEAFIVNLSGSSTTYACWNRVLMMIDLKSKEVSTLKKAVSVDETTAVSAEKFKVPPGYTLK